MFDRLRPLFVLVLLMVLHGGAEAFAENAWRVGKLSGDVAITSSDVQQASLTDGTMVKPGDAIRTGRNGRVLLLRGEESILIEPNSIVGIPAEKKDDALSTTILQKAGSILLDVEKRNVNHFAVETPYLAAVVKGTQFRVTVNKNSARVDVLRGQVEVSDFKSGKFALVLPGQAARVWAHGAGGLTLSGTGTLSPIQKGEPRASSVKPTQPPAESRSTLRSASNGQRLQIKATLGEVKLDVSKATQGLARASSGDNAANRDGSNSGASALSDGAGLSARSAAFSGGGISATSISAGGISAGLSLSGGGGVSVGGISTGGGTAGGVAPGGGVAGTSPSGGGLLAGVLGTTTGIVGGVTKKLLSDIRLKRDIVLVDRLDNGLGLYRYRYLWSDTVYVGVMAQEVKLVRSDAVLRGADGYLRVDYAALGLPFQTFGEWAAASKNKEIIP